MGLETSGVCHRRPDRSGGAVASGKQLLPVARAWRLGFGHSFELTPNLLRFSSEL